MTDTNYREAERVHTSVLAAAEKRLLIWIAARLPRWVNSDHLTVLAGLAMAAAGMCYWFGPGSPLAMATAILMLGLNWFGDSLDGTLARVRHHERPRYGFYVDHVLDVIGILFLLAGFALGGFMTPVVAAGFLVAYYLLMVEIGLATHAVGTFRISFWKFGPTELRILLIIGTLQILRSPFVTIAGERMLLFDVSGVIASAILGATFIASAVRNGRLLFKLEPLPEKKQAAKNGEPDAEFAIKMNA
ncbi:MAG: CDP-alcohol phosphatidyltransferase family protein [Acidobacteriota bacterium]|nr:CDP-alcohol phosphatidyltransferase family protein [Acidobacteriota bacterium]MDQ3421417.1 CDP-alcohol phosphatidyltransferase family protein [Acidobacteriota bacterium]